ncbi:MAG: cytochrome c3 family protein [Campylobacteraceae bacterium]|nr:cytochrome c3 family protein [Campylobacteraceae bacterium]
MRIFFLIFSIFLYFAQARVPEKFSNSKYCIGCHTQKGIDWKTTWHSKSNSTKNILYKKVMTYVSDMTYKSLGSMEVECGQCHSPKMGVKKIDFSYDLSKTFGIETNETKKVEKAMHNETSDDGISCIICHNIDKIKHTKQINTRGFEAVEFGAPEVMYGPFSQSNRTTYHKMQKKDYFNQDANRLCLVCHYGYKNKKMYDYATGIEYESTTTDKKCVDCHMGELKKSIVAPKIVGKIKAIQRETRRHLFKGARNSDILKSSLDISVEKNSSAIKIKIKNITPHNVPTGFTGREINISVIYKKDEKTIGEQSQKINTLYVDEDNQETLSYVASKMVYDKRLKPNEVRNYIFNNIKGANKAVIEITYRLIKSSLIPLLGIKDGVFTKKYK